MDFFQSLNFMKVNFNKAKYCELIGNELYSSPGNSLVAEFYLKNFNYLEIHFKTKDNKKLYRTLELYKDERIPFEIVDNELYNSDGLFVCQHCNRPIFKVFEKDIYKFSLYVKCKCGIIYDHIRDRKNK